MDPSYLLSLSVLILLSLIKCSSGSKSGFYISDGFGQDKTVLVEKLSKKQQRLIKEEMLHILGLEKVPKLRKNKAKAVPQYMLDLYRKYAQNAENEVYDSVTKYSAATNEFNDNQPDLVISFVNQAHKQNHLRHDRNRMYYFDFNTVPATESVCQADFRVYKLPAEPKISEDKRLVVSVYKLAKKSLEADPHLVLESQTKVRKNYKGWIDFNITGAATEWTYYPVTNLGLFMEIKDDSGNSIDPKSFGLVGRKGPDDVQPFLVAYFKSSKQINTRTKRSVDPVNDGRSKRMTDMSSLDSPFNNYAARRTRCERQVLYVNFADLNWSEWIISPKGYSAFYCKGQCAFPLNSHMNATNHAIVQTLVSMKRSSIPEPCCAPTKLSPVPVLYFDEHNHVILHRYKNMVVKACGCL